MHHKNEVTKIIHKVFAGSGMDIPICKIHELMDEYSKDNELKAIIHAHRYALAGKSLQKTIEKWKK